MFWLRLVYVTVVWLSIVIRLSHAQVDVHLCPTGAINTKDPRWSDIARRFEIETELVTATGTAELSQAFSTQRDVIDITISGVNIREHWYFDTNEQLTIFNLITNGQEVPECVRTKIDATTPTSHVNSKTTIKPSVLFGYDARNQPNPEFGIQYVNNSTMRQIPVNIFTSCFYVPDLRATVAATYYMSDVTKFLSYLPRNQSLPIRIDVRVKESMTGVEESYLYNIFRFLPNPTIQQERHALETPAGVFCQNRTNTKPVPTDIPDRASFNGEFPVLFKNSSIVYSTSNAYDKLSQFVLVDLWQESSQHFTELHDFGTGLAYQYDHALRRCKVTDVNVNGSDAVQVTGRPELVQMGNGLHMFLMDDITFHYTGSKQCRDRVMCHVWIGEKPLANSKGYERREWHWAYQFNNQLLSIWVPMKLVLNTVDSSGNQLISFETNLFNFRRDPMAIFEIDYIITDCYRAMGPTENFHYGVLTFTIDNDFGYPVQQNILYLQSIIWETLAKVLQVRPIRLSEIAIDHEGTDLIVTFTLLDVPPRFGPVDVPLYEYSLDILLDHLRALINANNLTFRATFEAKEFTLRVKNDSLNVVVRTPPPIVIDVNVTVPVYQTVTQIITVTETETIVRTSGSKITGLWIGFIIAGLVVGLIAGVVVLRASNRRS